MTRRIASVETFVVRYPIVGHFKFFSRPTRDTVVVKITDEAGNIGWGQSVPSPSWSYETLESVRTTLDHHLAPVLVGLDSLDTEAIWRTMNRAIAPSFSTGQPIAKSGIDLALWDLTNKATPCLRPSVTLSWTVDVRTVDELGPTIAEAHSRGYRHFNVKVGTDARLDIALCREIRRLAPEAFIWVDANGGYDLHTALAVAPKFADLGIAALEQPLPANRLTGFRKLREQKALPILMDEPVVSLVDIEEFHALGLLDGVAMKVSRCGGLTEARRMVAYLREHGLLFFASGLTDPDIALAASLLLFSTHGLAHPAALNAPQFLTGSILKKPIAIHGDQAAPPDGPGLGIEVNVESLQS